MRARRLLPLAAFALLALAPRALRADEELPGSNGTAGFNVTDVALSEAAFPADGSLKAVAAPAEDAKTIEAFLKTTAGAAASSADPITRSFATADGKPVTVVLADTFGDPAHVVAAVKEGAAAKGWAFGTLGHPSRLVVVAGPAGVREKVRDLQTTFAIKMLRTRLDKQLETGGDEATAVAGSLLNLEPKDALANALAANAYAAAGAQEKDAALSAKAVPHFKAALDKDAVRPLTGDMLIRAKGVYGDLVLNGADGKPSAEARDLLAEVVKALPGSKIQPQAAIGWRYNLACAHARLGDKDAAFEQLTLALEANDKTPVRGISHWRKDTDFASLKDDPRWAKTLEKFPPKKGESEEGDEGGMEGGEGGMEGGMEGGEPAMDGGGK